MNRYTSKARKNKKIINQNTIEEILVIEKIYS